jgi:hypothetical protein
MDWCFMVLHGAKLRTSVGRNKVKYVSTKQSVCLISEDLMFYRDKVVLGKAKLLDDEAKLESSTQREVN